jgi:exopolyphosphatase/guanosine-5'-triphosphate,3'-diphosphate pyrophosphatase
MASATLEDAALRSPRAVTGPLAAIDIGTNSIRLIIAEGLPGGRYRILDDEKEQTRLGQDLARSGKLAPEAVERSLAVLLQMKHIAVGYGCRNIRAIATCAVREASDGADFCRRVQEEVGLEIEVISAKQEGRLAFRSVERNFELAALDVAVADIGGGSTEIVAAAAGVIEEIYKTRLGAVRLTDRFGSDQKLSSVELKQMCEAIDQELREAIPEVPFRPHVLIGTGGTFTSLASMLMNRAGKSQLPIKGFVARRADVSHLLDALSKLGLRGRQKVPGLSADRADIIVAGLAVIDRLMGYLGVNRLQIHNGGVRDGLLLGMVEEAVGTPRELASIDRDTATLRFAAQCGVDLPHSEHVGRLATRMWVQLSEMELVRSDDRDILEAAAILQDVGYLINYESHHKHSYHLILNSDLAGFQPHELLLIGNVARYHRGSEPKRKHENYEQLSEDQQLRVRHMASVLRLAGGLDRSHTQQVTGVRLEREGDVLHIVALSESLPEVDLWGVRRRAEMFERTFGLRIEARWETPSAADLRWLINEATKPQAMDQA